MNPESNPADFTVDQVTKYLATADAAEAERVKALEADGKARRGVLDYVPDADDVEPDEDGYTRVPVPTDQAYVPGEPIPETSEAEDAALEV